MTTPACPMLVLGEGFTPVKPSTIKPDFTPPAGFSVVGGSRNFIVLIESRDEAWDLILVIGPPQDSGSYFHKDLLAHVQARYRNFEISGGGRCECKWSDYEKKWTVHFSGQSGDFGVYDARLLDNRIRATLAEELGLPCRFEWHGY